VRLASVKEGAALALDQLRVNKTRSALTILGIVVGVATVMVMSAMIAGIRHSVVSAIEAAGPKNFLVARFDYNQVQIVSDGSPPPWAANPPITVEEARAIERLDAVKAAIVSFDLFMPVTAGSERVDNVQVSAAGPGWEAFTIGSLVAGRHFLAGDVAASRPVVVITKPLAEALFGSLDPIGRQVRLGGTTFQVIGIYELGENIFASLVKHIAIVPYTAALKYLDSSPEMIAVEVVTASHATIDEAMDQVIGLLRGLRGLRPGDPNNFAIIRQEETLATFNRLTAVFFLVMIGLSSVALLVGGVGVIAIMMIAVTERTREIGIRKAIGATRREILWQFLCEAATLTLVGGAIGLAIGGGLTFLISSITPIPARVPATAIVAALAMAAVAGVAFGLFPAWRAARMDPVVALRYE
jgi:putative ABC transport system permease protein